MQAIGPEFLHRPLPGLNALSLTHAWDWIIKGLAIAAPPRLRETRWRAIYQFVPAYTDAGDGVRQSIERSWLGALRFAPVRINAPEMPLAIELPARDVYETNADLPLAARGALREAIGHRLDVLSPLPTHNVEFAIGRVTPSPPDRLDVAIAIVRKETIARLLDSPDGGRIGIIGAAPDASAAFEYVLYRQARSGPVRRRGFLKSLALLLGAGLLVLGADMQLGKRIAAASAHEAALLKTLRAEKEMASFLADLPPAPPQIARSIAIKAELDRLSSALPDGVWLEELSMTTVDLSASGFVRRNAVWPKAAAPVLSQSDRPDVDRFTLPLAADQP